MSSGDKQKNKDLEKYFMLEATQYLNKDNTVTNNDNDLDEEGDVTGGDEVF